MPNPLSPDLLAKMHAYWRAANYLSVGQIYLQDNPLLETPLTLAHIKPRLLGHWGTTTGLNFLYVHLNRLIKENDLDMIYVIGPGHGGPGLVAHAYLEGSYTERYPAIERSRNGLQRLFRQFSWPYGIPSHVAPETPGSIHEGGELGYSLLHAYGAAFDNPDLIVACVIGDGEAETGPLAASWHSNKFLNPARDGAVLPILHLNGFKIANPTVLARISRKELTELLRGYGYDPYFVEGSDPAVVHQSLAATLDTILTQIRRIQSAARSTGAVEPPERPRWPMIVFRTPKGWTGPKFVDGKPVEGTWRAHQVPIADFKNPEHVTQLEEWMQSYRPRELFDEHGKFREELAALAPTGHHRMGSNPHANGGELMRPLSMPHFQNYAVAVPAPGGVQAEATRVLGIFLRDVMKLNLDTRNFRLFGPDETASNRLEAVFEVSGKEWMAEIDEVDINLVVDGRVMEVLSEHLCEGWLEGYLLTGRHGLFSCYEAFIHIIDSMFNQHAKWLKVSRTIPWRKPIASLNYLLTSHVWRQDHNGFSHQDPGFIDHVASKKSDVVRIYLPPDANCLLSVADHCLRSRNYINLIVAGKQPEWQWLDIDAAVRHCTAGAGTWHWASTDDGRDPDVVMACCGDVPTLETMAAVTLLRSYVPDIRIRVVNVVDLMVLQPQSEHPHGLEDQDFDELFTTDQPVIFAFHGYPAIIHQLTYRRHNHDNIHVRGYKEEGTTTTPFDMVVLNNLDRYQLALDAIRRIPRLADRVEQATARYWTDMERHKLYISEHGDDMPEVRDSALDRLSMAAPETELTILALNSGSSSLKFGLYRTGPERTERLLSGEAEAIGDKKSKFSAQDRHGNALVSERVSLSGQREAIVRIAKLLADADQPAPVVIGHRIVHGGPRRRQHCLIDGPVLRELEAATAFAPLHTPPALAVIRFAQEHFPGLPQAACLDTAFHAGLPEVARVLPIPRELRSEGIQRYGFHGLSCESILHQLGSDLPDRLVIAHLGNGASVTAVKDGRSIDTSMGLTPTGGVIMGTRSGDLDPGVLVYLMRENKLDAVKLEELIDHHSGLLGISGVSSDMRSLRKAAPSNPGARLAVEMFCYSVRKQIAAMAAALTGVDLIVFTGGIGENDPEVRAEICHGLSWMGVAIDGVRNLAATNPLSGPISRCPVLVLGSQEDEQIARHAWALFNGRQVSEDRTDTA